jgi:glycosyltransferase involved in cell wall biosynthesis
MLIVTNFKTFPETWTSDTGVAGRTVYADAGEFEAAANTGDADAVFVVNCDVQTVLQLASRRLVRRGASTPVVAVDLVLRIPSTLRAKILARLKRVLFSRVDLFINYFRDVSALDRYYGIGPARSAYVPFKSNLWSHRVDEPNPDGGYVLCFGRSLRDFDTFFDAMERIKHPGVIVDPRSAKPEQHGSRFTRSLDTLPANVRVVVDDMSDQSQLDLLKGARLVVVPIVGGSIVCSGISTILNAMALGKCVVTSEGVGVTEIFDDELLTVPVEDAAALADTLDRAWTDHELRARVAEAGWRYALECGPERQMFQRIIDCLAARGIVHA